LLIFSKRLSKKVFSFPVMIERNAHPGILPSRQQVWDITEARSTTNAKRNQ